jgi:predicted MFS family arabinose efflux permease
MTNRLENRLEWILMIIGIVTAIGSMITAIVTNHSFTWQIITVLWIGACMLKQGTIENLTKK